MEACSHTGKRGAGMLNLIPPMTDPLGRYWHQPKLLDVAVYEDIAIMDKETLNQLAEYSFSVPSGVYAGKMWRCRKCDEWFLRWYGGGGNDIAIHERPIRVLE